MSLYSFAKGGLRPCRRRRDSAPCASDEFIEQEIPTDEFEDIDEEREDQAPAEPDAVLMSSRVWMKSCMSSKRWE